MSFGKWDNAGKDGCPKANIPLKTDYLLGLRNDLMFYFIGFFFFCFLQWKYANLFYFTYYFQFFKHLLDFYSEQIIMLGTICCPVAQSGPTLCIFETPWTAACQASLSFHISWSFLKLMSIKSVMPSNHLILCHPILLLPAIFPSIRVFSNESVLHIRWPKYWSFSFSISPSNEYSELISFRINWFDLLAVQGMLRVFFNTTTQKHQFLGVQPSL